MNDPGSKVTLSPPSTEQFPTAVIVAIAIGGWIFLIIVVLIIRKVIQDKGYCSQFCDSFQCCTGCRESAGACFISFAQSCDFKLPTKQGIADLFCPNPENCAGPQNCCGGCQGCCQGCCDGCCDGACDGCCDGCCNGNCCQCTCQAPNCDVINCFCCEITMK